MKRTIKFLILCLLSTFFLIGVGKKDVFAASETAELRITCTSNQVTNLQMELKTGATNDSIVEWWKDDDGKYYLFLPSFADLSNVIVTIEDTNGNVSSQTLSWGKLLPSSTITNGSTLSDMDSGTYSLKIGSTSYTIVIMQSENIPAMFISDVDSSSIQTDKEYKYEGGNMILVTEEGNTEYDGALSQMKGRGNSSWKREKKPFQIKLDKKKNLLEMGESKTWILLANAADESLIRNKLVFDLAEQVGINYASKGEWIDLYVDGVYYGNYLLCEKVEIGTNRINITDLEGQMEELLGVSDFGIYKMKGTTTPVSGTTKSWMIPTNPDNITGGYLIEKELHSRYQAEASGFVTSRGQATVVKSPEYASVEEMAYISEYFQDFEDAIYSTTGRNAKGLPYTNYVNLDSLVNMYLIDEITENIDAGVSSSYFYKDANAIAYAGPVWDYDRSMGEVVDRNGVKSGNPNSFWAILRTDDSEDGTDVCWYQALYQQSDFYQAVVTKYQNTYVSELNEVIQTKIPEYVSTIQKSAAMNQVVWNTSSITTEANSVKTFLTDRKNFLTNTWVNHSQVAVNFAGTPANGSATVTTMSAECGQTITLPTASYSGYSFKGWSYNGKTYSAGESFIVPSAGITFTGVWIQNKVETAGVVSSTRIGGDTRYDTAINCAEAIRAGGTLDCVVVANANNFPDALTGSVLAASKNAPILLVGDDETQNAKTIQYIENYVSRSGTIYLLGGTAAVPQSVQSVLQNDMFASVVRLSGDTRYDTNLSIVNELSISTGTDVFVVSGTNYADSLSISGIAGAGGMPIFMATDTMTDSMLAKIAEISPKHIYIIGGTAAVSDTVAAQLSGYGKVVRVQGATRYETSLEVAKYFSDSCATTTVIASGSNFPDGLAGGVLAAKNNATVLLVNEECNAGQVEYVKNSNITNLYIMGGNAAVSDSVVTRLTQQ